MPSETIQWFPGHMAKTRRLISENLRDVDIILELRDARIPRSSKNPEIASLCRGKPILTLLNKCSLSDEGANKLWQQYGKENGENYLFTDCQTGAGISSVMPAITSFLSEKLERYDKKGMSGRAVRAMIVGIPNVGKSSLINRLCKGKKAKVENRPGVTLAKQWVPTSIGLDLMDMPGVLWPKFEDRNVGECLAVTGAIRDQILDTEEIARILIKKLQRLYPEMLAKRYSLDCDISSMTAYEIFLLIGKKRGMLISGGEINEERTALMLLDEFRSAKIGKITLERP